MQYLMQESSALIAFEDELLDSISKKKVKSVSCVKLFYITDKRNAWHSTEVRRWYSDSFHLTLNSAKRRAESMRISGSVFYIREVPAICIESGKSCVFISEVNTKTPLKEFQYLADKIKSLKSSLIPVMSSLILRGSRLQ